MRGIALLMSCIAALSSVLSYNDTDILAFALNLECLEAEYYSFASSGTGLASNQTGNGPQPIGGEMARLSGNIAEYASGLSTDENDHVAFLNLALGNMTVSCPLVDLNTSFSGLMDAAMNTTLDPPFSPYVDDASFLIGAFIFEDIGVTAYLGALGLLKTLGLMSAAASIAAVEAYHAATVRTLLNNKLDMNLQNYNFTISDALGAISMLRAQLGGGKEDLYAPDNSLSIAPADDHSLAFSRNVTEILNIATFGSANYTGGFYPAGLTGAIH